MADEPLAAPAHTATLEDVRCADLFAFWGEDFVPIAKEFLRRLTAIKKTDATTVIREVGLRTCRGARERGMRALGG